MHIANTMKRTALAALLVVATSGASLAAVGWMDDDAVVRHKPAHVAKKVNWVHDGQKVNVVAAYKSWYKVQVPGKDGWVKKSLVSFGKPHWSHYRSHFHGYGHLYGYSTGGSFCVKGKSASICIGAGF